MRVMMRKSHEGSGPRADEETQERRVLRAARREELDSFLEDQALMMRLLEIYYSDPGVQHASEAA